MGVHSQLQSLQSFQEYPGIEGAHARPGGPQETEHFLADEFLRSHYGTAYAPSLTVQVLGSRMNHDVGTKRKGLLQCGSAEAIVHGKQRPMTVGKIRHGLHVHDHGQRVGRRFDQ